MDFIEIVVMFLTLGSIILIWKYSHQQIKEIKNQNWVTIYSIFTKRYANIIEQFPENINENDFRYNPKNRNKTLRAMRQYFDLCYEEYSLYHTYHFIDEKLWKDWAAGIKSALSKSAFREAWIKTISKDTIYSQEFVNYINTIIED